MKCSYCCFVVLRLISSCFDSNADADSHAEVNKDASSTKDDNKEIAVANCGNEPHYSDRYDGKPATTSAAVSISAMVMAAKEKVVDSDQRQKQTSQQSHQN